MSEDRIFIISMKKDIPIVDLINISINSMVIMYPQNRI